MTSRLIHEGWVSPANPGPTRRAAAQYLAIGVILLVGWWLLAAGGGVRLLDTVLGEDAATRNLELRVAEDGTARITTAGSSKARAVRVEQRSDGATSFLVYAGSLDLAGDRAVRLRVVTPAGVDASRAAVRLVLPNGSENAEDGRFLVTLRADLIADAKRRSSAGSLRAVTAPIDEQIREIRADRARFNRLADGWWWIIPLGIALSVALPIVLWWRARRSAFVMRVPGPGVEPTSAPPSSLDPIGVAVLVAGARDVDDGAAFAGHVLDLIERKQLLMRRTLDPAYGAGTLIGLGHADDLSDDPAVAALRSIAQEDELTVAIPDAPPRRRRAPHTERAAWHAHVAGRARFERVVQLTPARRIDGAFAVITCIGVVAVIAAVIANGDGAASTAWLITALACSSGLTLAAWSKDARRWRIVSRARRTERAQWLAWRSVVGTADGPALDARNLSLIAAAGTQEGIVRAVALQAAVGLDAVTFKTLESLGAVVADEGP